MARRAWASMSPKASAEPMLLSWGVVPEMVLPAILSRLTLKGLGEKVGKDEVFDFFKRRADATVYNAANSPPLLPTLVGRVGVEGIVKGNRFAPNVENVKREQLPRSLVELAGDAGKALGGVTAGTITGIVGAIDANVSRDNGGQPQIPPDTRIANLPRPFPNVKPETGEDVLSMKALRSAAPATPVPSRSSFATSLPSLPVLPPASALPPAPAAPAVPAAPAIGVPVAVPPPVLLGGVDPRASAEAERLARDAAHAAERARNEAERVAREAERAARASAPVPSRGSMSPPSSFSPPVGLPASAPSVPIVAPMPALPVVAPAPPALALPKLPSEVSNVIPVLGSPAGVVQKATDFARANQGALALGTAVTVLGAAGAAAAVSRSRSGKKKSSSKKSSKSKASRSYSRRSKAKAKAPAKKRRREDRSGVTRSKYRGQPVYRTKNGRPYVILKSGPMKGMARFIPQ